MKSLVIGAGQIGQAIYEIVKPFHEASIRDITEDSALSHADVLHICYPDGLYFVTETLKYKEQYKPSLTIIHSSVALGKTEQCGEHVVHCPLRGRHPKLAREIPAFTLFVGGTNKNDVLTARSYLEGCDLVTLPGGDPRTTELCKLLSNIHLGVEIAWRQEVQRILDNFEVPASTYKQWEDSYNLGYRVTGDEHLTRPTLDPGPIGGHCILQCINILAAQYPSHLFDFIRESNEKTKRSIRCGDGETPATIGIQAANA